MTTLSFTAASYPTQAKAVRVPRCYKRTEGYANIDQNQSFDRRGTLLSILLIIGVAVYWLSG